MAMGRARWGKLTEAWVGEARDFTPELAQHLDVLDEGLGLGLAGAATEVPATGGRRIDIVASGSEGQRYVIENQYGRADHDHLTRGLAYAVSADAAGLILVAEEHRDEFRDIAHYLNDVAARAGGGIKVWLVEARAVQVDGGPWAPVFSVVAAPSSFVQAVAGSVAAYERNVSIGEVLDAYSDPQLRSAAQELAAQWNGPGFRLQPYLRGGNYMLGFWAPGPSASRMRAVITAYPDGRLYVPFGAYQGKNSGIPVEGLDDEEFMRATTEALDLTNGYTPPGWFRPERLDEVVHFCLRVAAAYLSALGGGMPDAGQVSASAASQSASYDAA